MVRPLEKQEAEENIPLNPIILIEDENPTCSINVNKVDINGSGDSDEVTRNEDSDPPDPLIANPETTGSDQMACSGFMYPQLLVIGLIMVALDLITDVISALENFRHGTQERGMQGILIILPIIINAIVHQTSDYYQ